MKAFPAMTLLLAASTAGAVTGALENPQPGATESGIAVISGWVCQATSIEVTIDGGPRQRAPYGSARADTASVCGGKTDNGFSLLFNYNTLGSGPHTLTAYVDGVELGTVQFGVKTLAGEFLTGVSASAYIDQFPVFGERTRLAWQQSKQNFIVTAIETPPSIAGVYRGAYTYNRFGCAADGAFMDNASFSLSVDSSGPANRINIVMTTASGLSCTFPGDLVVNSNGGYYTVGETSYSCSDGTSGVWSSTRIDVTPTGFSAGIDQRSGDCETLGRLGGPRE
jgi:hypothetical protein